MRRAVVILWALCCVFLLGSLYSSSASASETPPSPAETVTVTTPPDPPVTETATVTATPTETATVVMEPTSTATVVVTEPAEPSEPGCGTVERPCVTSVVASTEDEDFRAAMTAAGGVAVAFLAVLALGTLRRR